MNVAKTEGFPCIEPGPDERIEGEVREEELEDTDVSEEK